LRVVFLGFFLCMLGLLVFQVRVFGVFLMYFGWGLLL
jgi:hypothetical protein